MKKILLMFVIILSLAGNAEAGELVTFATVTNRGNETAQNVIVYIPIYNSDSSYQTMETDDNRISGEYVVCEIGDIPAGGSALATVRYNVEHHRVGYTRNAEYKLAKKIYDGMPKTGNCRTLAREYIARCTLAGLTAREVVGYARPSRVMTVGSLIGNRHSWAEVSVGGRWMPVDLTFKLFGVKMDNHIIEGYSDKNLRVQHNGGKLSVIWGHEWNERTYQD